VFYFKENSYSKIYLGQQLLVNKTAKKECHEKSPNVKSHAEEKP